MRPFFLSLFVFLMLQISVAEAQSYLRVSDPNNWSVPITSTPDWHEWRAHGQFDEVSIVANPQGVFTQVEVYVTISQGPDAWTWTDNYEIVWQFELPGQAIVHDSWLWVGPDIIKADVVDYWTALQTYEDIVDRNQDPSFLYRLGDGRYEIRIFPLPEGETRRIKMSFLIPTRWDTESVKSALLHNMLQSTDYISPYISISTPVSDLWGTPALNIGTNFFPFTDTITNGVGSLMHYLEVETDDFILYENVNLVTEAPLAPNNSFVSTLSDNGDHFYQLVFVPDWETAATPPAKKSLVLIEYDSTKTALSKTDFISWLQGTLSDHFSIVDHINMCVVTSGGIQFLNDEWWPFEESTFNTQLADLLNTHDQTDLELLLSEGFSWAQNQTEIDEIFLLAANDEFVYPPAADDVFSNLENLLPADVPLTILDYQTENISIIFYDNEEYHGNEYFYQLLAGNNAATQITLLRNAGISHFYWLEEAFPDLSYPTGLIDFNTSLESGIAYQRYNLSNMELNQQNKGVIMQTGKYLGDFPLHIEANLITPGGSFYTLSNTVLPMDILTADTLLRESWYGPHLKELEVLASTEEDRLSIIDQSIEERVLTGLTAFLALEPDQGGEPCIDCLLNSGEIILINVEDNDINLEEAIVTITPNPAVDIATIRLSATAPLRAEDWTATVFDVSGKLVAELTASNTDITVLEWAWTPDSNASAGLYFIKLESRFGKLIGKIVLVK